VTRITFGFRKENIAGIYIMQNTTVRGWGEMISLGGKMKKGKEKKEENYIKTG